MVWRKTGSHNVLAQSEIETANRRAKARQLTEPKVVWAHYDTKTRRIELRLTMRGFGEAELKFLPSKAQGLENATPSQLDPIEISPSGFGIYFPKLDADLWVPSLLQGIFGSEQWMASHFGQVGGQSKSKAKAAASRENGKLGGRPKKQKRNQYA